MSILKEITKRSKGNCELCASADDLFLYTLPPASEASLNHTIHICTTCQDQITDPSTMSINHWRCLNESMWSDITVVQVMSWRLLNRIRHEGWPQDLLDMLFLDEETLTWAKAEGDDPTSEDQIIHKDSNGAVLSVNDTVVLIKDLKVKGANFTAKRGTAVRNIRLVQDHSDQIEGKVNGQQIVLLTQYVKNQNNTLQAKVLTPYINQCTLKSDISLSLLPLCHIIKNDL